MKSEWESKLDRVIGRRYKAKLMNNTKWREVFTCLAKRNIRFQVVWVNDPDFPRETVHGISESLVGERGLLDPGIGGPCFYKEIEYIRIPKWFQISNAKSGDIHGYQEKEVEGLLDELANLGQLPLSDTDRYVEIRGYI